MIVKYHFVRIE